MPTDFFDPGRGGFYRAIGGWVSGYGARADFDDGDAVVGYPAGAGLGGGSHGRGGDDDDLKCVASSAEERDLQAVLHAGYRRHVWRCLRRLYSVEYRRERDSAVHIGVPIELFHSHTFQGLRLTPTNEDARPGYAAPLGLVGGFFDAIGGCGWGRLSPRR